MNDIQHPRRGGRRDGVALVIVLGMLSLLMIMAVAFSISMRIERSAAGNYASSIQAKHLVWVALGRAVAAADDEMNANTNGFKLYPEWYVLPSPTNAAPPAPVGVGNALDYVPDFLASIVATSQCGWNTFDLGTNSGSAVGSYAFLVVNTSGFLDANKVGNTVGVQRVWGTNAMEMKLDRLPDIGSSAAAVNFVKDRTVQGRYEDMSELIWLNSVMNATNDNFVTYSMAPEQKSLLANDKLTNKVYVGGDLASIQASQALILTALNDSGLSGADAAEAKNTAYLNLLDYVDTDCIPQQLNAGCSELVPMVNEVILDYEATAASGACTVVSALTVEWFYPFDVGTPYTNQLRMDLVGMTAAADAGNTDPQLVPVLPASYSEAVNVVGKHAFGTVTVNPPDRTFAVDTGNPIRIAFTAEVKAKVLHLASGQYVDSVPFPDTKPGVRLKFDFTIPPVGVGSKVVLTQEWAECIDPRFNWDPANTVTRDQWAYSGDLRGAGGGVPAQSTLGAMNEYTKYILADSNKTYGVEFDGMTDAQATYLYVANRPLRNVGELGYITTRPWSTIRLYTHGTNNPVGGDFMYNGKNLGYHRVLDYFTVFPPSVLYRRGLVNINMPTNHPDDALATVFYGAPEKEYSSSPTNITWATAKTIARRITLHGRPGQTNGQYRNLSEIGGFVTNWWSGAPSEIVREAPIRNSAGLLTTRQNLFTILFVTGIKSKGLGAVGSLGMGELMSYQKSVAVVWRDPFQSVSLEGRATNHWWFVKSLKTIDE